MPDVEIIIENNEFLELLVRVLRSPDYAKSLREQELSRLGQKLENTEKNILGERRYTGNLINSVGYKVVSEEELVVGPNVTGETADGGKVWSVWKGGSPNKLWVDTPTLQGWMSARGIDSSLLKQIQYSIYRKGTSAWREQNSGSMDWPFPEDTLTSTEGQKAMQDATKTVQEETITWIGDKK